MVPWLGSSQESRLTWDADKTMTIDLVTELKFWQSNLKRSNGLSFKNTPQITQIVYSDASAHSYGGFTIQKQGQIVARGDFKNEEVETSSTFRELLAVKYVLQSFSNILSSHCVQWLTDNTNVPKIITAGSRRHHLQELALNIYNICIIYSINLYPAWIPREQNKIADTISKEKDSDNWGIDTETFQHIQSVYGCFSVDRFADNNNKKVENFNSKYFCPGSKTVNAFSTSWKNDFNWLCPPINLIGKTIKYLKMCNGKGVLFVPIWKSAYYWPLLTSNGQTFNSFIKHFLILDPYFINHARLSDSVFDGFATFYSLALLVDFSRENP